MEIMSGVDVYAISNLNHVNHHFWQYLICKLRYQDGCYGNKIQPLFNQVEIMSELLVCANDLFWLYLVCMTVLYQLVKLHKAITFQMSYCVIAFENVTSVTFENVTSCHNIVRYSIM